LGRAWDLAVASAVLAGRAVAALVVAAVREIVA
jgi:hypothetical protein